MRVQETAAPIRSPCCSSQERAFNSGIRLTSTTSPGLLRFSFICAIRSVPPASGRASLSARERRSIASCKLCGAAYANSCTVSSSTVGACALYQSGQSLPLQIQLQNHWYRLINLPPPSALLGEALAYVGPKTLALASSAIRQGAPQRRGKSH